MSFRQTQTCLIRSGDHKFSSLLKKQKSASVWFTRRYLPYSLRMSHNLEREGWQKEFQFFWVQTCLNGPVKTPFPRNCHTAWHAYIMLLDQIQVSFSCSKFSEHILAPLQISCQTLVDYGYLVIPSEVPLLTFVGDTSDFNWGRWKETSILRSEQVSVILCNVDTQVFILQ